LLLRRVAGHTVLAMNDFLELSPPYLLRPVRVAKHLTSQRNEIAFAFGNRAGGQIRIIELGHRNDRDIDNFFDSRREVQKRSGQGIVHRYGAHRNIHKGLDFFVDRQGISGNMDDVRTGLGQQAGYPAALFQA